MKRPKPQIPTLAIDNHPDLVTNPAIALNPARNALKGIWTDWDRLREAEAVSTDKKRLAKAAQSVVSRAGDSAIKALQAMDGFRKQIELKLINEITPLRQDPVAAEIRAHFKGQKEVFAAVATAVRGKDRRTTAAILGAPGYLSGLTEDQKNTLLDLARESWFPEEVQTLKDIDRHSQRVILCLGTVKSTLEPLVKEWAGEAEEKAFAALQPKNGGAA